MNDNLAALKAIYVALGGEVSDVASMTSNAEVLTAIATVAAEVAAAAKGD